MAVSHLLGSLLLLCAIGTNQVQAVGNLVIVGGSLLSNNSYVYNQIIEWAGGAADAYIGVIVAASTTNHEAAAQDIINRFNSYGASNVVWIPIHIGNKDPATDPVWVDEVSRMSGFYFGGGQQWRIMESMLLEDKSPSPLLSAIQQRYRAGAVMAGSSAGAATQNEAVVVEPTGRSYEGLLKGAIPRGEGSGYDLVYLPEGGMGSIKGYIIDSHFSERGREGRLPRLCWDLQDDPKGALLGIGLDEDTALAISNVDEDNASGQVLGSNGVMFMDLTEAYEDTNEQYFSIHNIRTHYLTHGDTITLVADEVKVDEWKTSMTGNEENDHAETSNNIFAYQSGDNVPEYVRVARSLFNAGIDTDAMGLTIQTNPRFEVYLHESVDSEAWKGQHPFKHVDQVSYVNLYVDMFQEGTNLQD